MRSRRDPTAPKTRAQDFVVFFMSEEDKTSEASLRFWFNVADVDGDGALTASDLRPFFKEQEARMRAFGMEAVAFGDVLCQMSDLIKPSTPGRITLHDLLRPDRVKLTGVLFAALFNLAKFQSFEARDPVLVKQELNAGGVSQWDRFAQVRRVRGRVRGRVRRRGGRGVGGSATHVSLCRRSWAVAPTRSRGYERASQPPGSTRT